MTSSRNVLIVFSILLGFLIIPASAQSTGIANHVVINEVDLNPPGDDSLNISEWVEIYNPTSTEKDISGWQIASTTILKKTLTIPSGTVIGPGKFMTFSYQQLWFTDVSESVELRDKNGVVIDKTPVFSDLKNDFTSWQRIYDGYDIDSVDDWKFVTSTAGSSNGKLSSEVSSTGVSVSVSADKQNYLFGQTAVISGSVSEKVSIVKPFFQPAKIIVTVTGPNYYNQFELYPDLNLKYKTTLNLHKVLGFNGGEYNVDVTYAGSTANTSFSLGDVSIIDKETTQSELSIQTDKSEFIPGQIVTITATADEIIPFEGMKFNVKDPNGKIIFTGNLFPTNGKFTTTLFMTTVNPVYGTYEIIGEYFDKAAKTTFTLTKDVKEDVLISLWTDKEVYGLGDTVNISGRLNKLWTSTFDLEIIQTSHRALGVKGLSGGGFEYKILDSVRLNGDSTFTYSFTIPSVSDRLGDYRITVSKDIGSASKNIVVVSDPESYVPPSRELSVYTDKPLYDFSIDKKLTISGNIKNPVSRTSFETEVVKIVFLDSNGKKVQFTGLPEGGKRLSTGGIPVTFELTAIPEKSGSFSTTGDLSRLIFDKGVYTIRAIYSNHVAEATFEIKDTLQLGNRNIFATLDKSVYGFGETVTLTGNFATQTRDSQGISITLHKPDGNINRYGTIIDSGFFSWTWKTPVSEKSVVIERDRSDTPTNTGTYRLHLETESEDLDLFFKVSNNPDEQLTLPSFVVSTSKPIYLAGDKLVVEGTVLKRLQGTEGLNVPERVSIKVLDGKFPYRLIHESSVYPNQGGEFKTAFELPITLFPTGEYKVKATYNKKQVETMFSVVNDFTLGADGKVSLMTSIDKQQYYPGETVFVSGKPNKLVYLENYELSVIKKSTTEITCGTFYCGKHTSTPIQIRPEPNGAFSYVYSIPNKATSIGSYEVVVDMDFDTKSLKFDVVERPEMIEPEIPKKLIEKENRLSENKISIQTQQKTVDGLTWSPRVLLGSMITPDHNDVSDVNLRVSSESGVCVIGQSDECLVKNSTRKQGSIYDVVEIDGNMFNVRYSGPDVRLEKFSIIPTSSSEFLPESTWNVEVIKDDQISRLYYKINYSLLE